MRRGCPIFCWGRRSHRRDYSVRLAWFSAGCDGQEGCGCVARISVRATVRLTDRARPQTGVDRGASPARPRAPGCVSHALHKRPSNRWCCRGLAHLTSDKPRLLEQQGPPLSPSNMRSPHFPVSSRLAVLFRSRSISVRPGLTIPASALRMGMAQALACTVSETPIRQKYPGHPLVGRQRWGSPSARYHPLGNAKDGTRLHSAGQHMTRPRDGARKSGHVGPGE